MRIIGGKYKGKKLLFQKNLITRPLKDSVKENLFNITIKKESDYYSFFSLTSKEVDNLILEASSKETFEEAANIILNNINNDYSNKLTSKEIRSLLHKLKKDQSLPA